MNYYQPNYMNPYYGAQMQRMQQPMQPPVTSIQPTMQPIQNIGLQGKSVDSIDVVKAMDIPLDGTVSYFPLTDGSAIISKQLQMDGTSKTIIYEPVKADMEQTNVKDSFSEELKSQINLLNSDNIGLKESVNDIKDQLNSLNDNFTDLLKELKALKGGKK